MKNFKVDYSMNKFNDFKAKSLKIPIFKSKQKNKMQQEMCKLIKTENNHILKIKIGLIPFNVFDSSLWKFVAKIDTLSDRVSDDKYITENNNFFFENSNGDILFMNRSLIDPTLDIL